MSALSFNDRLLAWSTAVGTVVLCIPLVIYAVAARVQAEDAVAAVQAVGTDHEARIRALETQLGKIGSDVDWIRKSIEHKPAVAAN